MDPSVRGLRSTVRVQVCSWSKADHVSISSSSFTLVSLIPYYHLYHYYCYYYGWNIKKHRSARVRNEPLLEPLQRLMQPPRWVNLRRRHSQPITSRHWPPNLHTRIRLVPALVYYFKARLPPNIHKCSFFLLIFLFIYFTLSVKHSWQEAIAKSWTISASLGCSFCTFLDCGETGNRSTGCKANGKH